MADPQVYSPGARRWRVAAALAIGLLGGAGADAFMTLRKPSSVAAMVPSESPAHESSTGMSLALETTSKAQEEAPACSCIDGVETDPGQFPAKPHHRQKSAGRHAAPMRASLCAANAVAQQ